MLDDTKSAYYFLFIRAKEYYNRSSFNLVAKNKKAHKRRHVAACFGHAATWLKFSLFAPPWHAVAWPSHAATCWPLVFGWSALHATAWRIYVAVCSLTLPRIASFLLQIVRSLIFFLEHHLKTNNTHKSAQNGDKQCKNTKYIRVKLIHNWLLSTPPHSAICLSSSKIDQELYSS